MHSLKHTLTLCLSFSTCVISIVRATTLHNTVDGGDPSWYGYDSAVWSMIEVNCAILCSCLPTIRYFIAKLTSCLGLRSLHSRYFADDGGMSAPLSSQTKTNRASGFTRSRPGRGHTVDEVPLQSGAKKMQSFSEESHVGHKAQASSVDDLEHKWDSGFNSPGYPRGNYLAAWDSHHPGDNSPTNSKPSVDSSNVPYVQRRASEVELGQQILVTRTTIVQEDIRTDTPAASPLPR